MVCQWAHHFIWNQKPKLSINNTKVQSVKKQKRII